MESRPWPAPLTLTKLQPVATNAEDPIVRRALEMVNLHIRMYNASVDELAEAVANIATLTVDLNAAEADILVNAGNITTNAADIATNVTGIANLDTRLTAAEGDIDAIEADYLTSAYTGSANIVTVGTIGAGKWEGDPVDHERGGLETDISAYNGLVKIAAGSTSEVALPLVHENGGLEDDVSAYDGLLKITGGGTSAVTIPLEDASIASAAYWNQQVSYIPEIVDQVQSNLDYIIVFNENWILLDDWFDEEYTPFKDAYDAWLITYNDWSNSVDNSIVDIWGWINYLAGFHGL